MLALCLVWGVTTFFIFVFQCSPVSFAWSVSQTGGSCEDFGVLILGTNIPNVIIDFMILATPVTSIWKLSIPRHKKIFINIILCVGVA